MGSNYQDHLMPATRPCALAGPDLREPNENYRGGWLSPRTLHPASHLPPKNTSPATFPPRPPSGLTRMGFRAALILTLIKRKCPPSALGLDFLPLPGTFVQPLSWSLVPG